MFKEWRYSPQYYYVRGLMKRFFLLFGMGVMLSLAWAGFIILIRPDPLPTLPSNPQNIRLNDGRVDANTVLQLVNEERKKHGVAALESDPALTLVAETRAKDMALNSYYAHETLEGKYFYDYFKRFGFSTGFSCENLDLEFTDDESQYVHDWLTSIHGHKECMLNETVTKAGYATAIFSEKGENGSIANTYVVVAIHAAPPFKKLPVSSTKNILRGPSSLTSENQAN